MVRYRRRAKRLPHLPRSLPPRAVAARTEGHYVARKKNTSTKAQELARKVAPRLPDGLQARMMRELADLQPDVKRTFAKKLGREE